MRTIGLTGGVASGKSTVSRMLAELGAPIVDADLLARAVVEPGAEAYDSVVREFGPDIVLPDGTLDRKALGMRVFADLAARRRLEALVHPAVRARLVARLAELSAVGAPVAVLDIPLLIEGGLHRGVDEVWLVYVDPDTQLQRLMERDHLTRAAAAQRIAAQLPLADKRAYARVIIDNCGSIAETRAQVTAHWHAVLERAGEGGAGAR